MLLEESVEDWELKTRLIDIGVIHWKYWRDMSASGFVMNLQFQWRIQTSTSRTSVSRVPSSVILTAMVRFPSIHMETPSSVAAAVATAVQDRSLQTTSDFDYRVDEYVLLQEKMGMVFGTHQGIACTGLAKGWSCDTCYDHFADRNFGAKLHALNTKITAEEHKEMKERIIL